MDFDLLLCNFCCNDMYFDFGGPDSIELVVFLYKGEGMMTQEFEIEFSVSGCVVQRVSIADPKMTPEKLEKLLNSGKVVTSIEEGGVVLYTKNMKKIGKVNMVDNACEYFDFVVDPV